MIRFTKDTDGQFSVGQVVSLASGMEDAYVQRGVAQYYRPPERQDGPPADKVMKAEKVSKK